PMEYGVSPLAGWLPVMVAAPSAVASAAPAAPAGEERLAWRTWAGEEAAYRFAAAAGGDSGPWSGRNLRWEAMPPLYRYLPLTGLRPGARPLLIERESGETVAAEMPVGAGRAVLNGLDEPWRW